MSEAKRYKLFSSLRPEAIAFLPDEVVSAADYDALVARIAELEQQRGGVVLPDRESVIRKAVGMCNRIPGSTTWNAAEFAYDELVALLNPPGECVALPERWEDRLSRMHPTIQYGCWPKRWVDDAKSYELEELRALLAQQGKETGQ